MPFEPLEDNLLVKKVEGDAVSKGGIHLPDTARDRDRSCKGIVMAVGPGKTTDEGQLLPMPLRRGDCIYFNHHSGSEVKIDGDDLVIVSLRSVHGKVV